MSTTDKALHDNKLSQLALGGGAAASILLPQAVTKRIQYEQTRLFKTRRR